MLMEKQLVDVSTSMPQAEFLRITRKVTRDIRGSANDMDLCITTQVVPTPMHVVRQEMRYQSDDPLLVDLNDPAATPIGLQLFCDLGGSSRRERKHV